MRSRARRDENARWKLKPGPRVPVRRNLSHKELLRVFICRENLMRLAAPQLKRAADPRATCCARAREREREREIRPSARARCTRSWLLIVPNRVRAGEPRERTRRIYTEQCPAIRHDDLEKTCRVQRKTISRPGRSSKRGDPLNCLLTLLSIERRGQVDGVFIDARPWKLIPANTQKGVTKSEQGFPSSPLRLIRSFSFPRFLSRSSRFLFSLPSFGGRGSPAGLNAAKGIHSGIYSRREI